ncbi:MAG: SH3 domain-containing protein, partial [Janthinobacterium lividum]
PRAVAPPRHPAQPATPPTPAAVPAPEPEQPAEPQKGSNTGLPLPRFATLRSDEVNFRSGPGTRYPIEWVYKRRDLPVQIEREFEVWRLVRDQEGVKGWVHQATLAPRRTAIVIGAPSGPEQALRRDARDDASPVARLKPGVIVRLRACEATSPWCQAQVGDYRGWMKRTDLWGVSPDEAIQ